MSHSWRAIISKIFIITSILFLLAACAQRIHFSNNKNNTNNGESSLYVNYANGLINEVKENECVQTLTANECLIVTKDALGELLVTAFHTTNFAKDLNRGPIAFIVPEQLYAIGPKNLYLDQNEIVQENVFSEIKVKLLKKNTNKFYDVILSGQRYISYGFNSAMNNYATFYSENEGKLYITYIKEKNSQLPSGTYFGEIKVLALSPNDSHYSKSINVKILMLLE